MTWCSRFAAAFMVAGLLLAGGCREKTTLVMVANDVDNEYTNALRALLPLRLASSLDGRVRASAIFYPSWGTEAALFLVKKADGSHALVLFRAEVYLYGAFADDPTRRDIDVGRDFASVEVLVDDDDAERLIELWSREMRSGVLPEWDGETLDVDNFEFGLLLPPRSGGGFLRMEAWDCGPRTHLMRLCYELWAVDEVGDHVSRGRVLPSESVAKILREALAGLPPR
jgi:hypothetical protein